MLYHISKTAGLKRLMPQVSTHGKPYVYATDSLVTGLLFGAPMDDFDFIIESVNGIPAISECYPDALRTCYSGRQCFIYEVSESGFLRGMTSWSPELVSESEVDVLCETPVDDLLRRLLAEEARGALRIHRYEGTAACKRRISAHIVDRLIRFDLLDTTSERLLTHYGRLLASLHDIMDGHLL